MSIALEVVSVLALAAYGLIEWACVAQSKPTISRRIQGFVRSNPQIACLLACVVGWLLAHFTGTPG